jgi:hypothetical protein
MFKYIVEKWIVHVQQLHLGENMVDKAKGAKVKVLFQGLHMTHVVFVLVYNFKLYILGSTFNISF